MGEGRGLAGHADVGKPGGDGRGYLQVPGRPGAVTGQVAGVDAQRGQLAVEHAARLGARLPVDQAQPPAGDVAEAGDAVGEVRPQHQSLPPGAEPDHFGAPRQQFPGRAGVVIARAPAQVHAGDVHQAVRSQPERFRARARPPAQADRRVQQAQRSLEKRHRRIAPGHHQRRPGEPDRLHHVRPVAVGAEGEAARRQEPGSADRGAGQRERHELITHRSERDPGGLVVDRRHRAGGHRRSRDRGPEHLLDGHAEGAGKRQRHPQRRIGQAGLHRRDRLAGYAGHAGKLLLREAAGLTGQPQHRSAAAWALVSHRPARACRRQVIAAAPIARSASQPAL